LLVTVNFPRVVFARAGGWAGAAGRPGHFRPDPRPGGTGGGLGGGAALVLVALRLLAAAFGVIVLVPVAVWARLRP
jgi:hypothetical protein